MISVTIDPSSFESSIHRGLQALHALRKAGVPVVGVLFPETVEHGVLSVGSVDIASGEVTWTWVPG